MYHNGRNQSRNGWRFQRQYNQQIRDHVPFRTLLQNLMVLVLCLIITLWIHSFLRILNPEIPIVNPGIPIVKEKGKQNLKITVSDEKKTFSQNGEDGVIQSIFDQIGVTDKTFVEFGTQNASQTNTRVLRQQRGWTGLLMDGDYENVDNNLHKEFILPSNIVDLFRKYKVPKQIDLLSTDTDLKDFWISKAILEAGYRPRVIISEVNSSFRKDLAITVPSDLKQQQWDGTYYFGATPMAMNYLYRQFGYSLVHCETTGVNCFWIRNDLLSEHDRVTFNEMEQVLHIIQCADYVNDARVSVWPRGEDESQKWIKLELSKELSHLRAEILDMSADELDEQSCI